jgi:hypothetical protein
MNNDSTPPPAEDSLPPGPATDNASSEPDTSTAAFLEQVQRAPEQTASLKRSEAQFRKKQEFIKSLMTNLDVLIYLQLCILYYMECVPYVSRW